MCIAGMEVPLYIPTPPWLPSCTPLTLHSFPPAPPPPLSARTSASYLCSPPFYPAPLPTTTIPDSIWCPSPPLSFPILFGTPPHTCPSPSPPLSQVPQPTEPPQLRTEEDEAAIPEPEDPYADLGELEPVNLISFAYQIACGMVCRTETYSACNIPQLHHHAEAIERFIRVI